MSTFKRYIIIHYPYHDIDEEIYCFAIPATCPNLPSSNDILHTIESVIAERREAWKTKSTNDRINYSFTDELDIIMNEVVQRYEGMEWSIISYKYYEFDDDYVRG